MDVMNTSAHDDTSGFMELIMSSRQLMYRFPPSGLARSEEHTSELQSLMRISYAVFCLKKKNYPLVRYQKITSLNSSTYLATPLPSTALNNNTHTQKQSD